MSNDPSHPDQRPTLSIIIPVFNTEAYLEEALDSVLGQKFSDFEIIAVNDGTEDKSGEILDLYRQKDPRIRVYHRENAGLSATRNFGLEKAGGVYIYFFDSDDVLTECATGHLTGLLQESGSEIIGFSAQYIDKNSQPVQKRSSTFNPEIKEPVAGEDLLVKMMKSGTYSPVVSKYMYRKSFLQNNDMKFREGYIHEDEYYTIRALCLAKRAISVSDVYYKHRVRAGSIMSKKPDIENLKGWAEAVSQILAFIDHYPLKPATRQIVLERTRKLAHNSVKVIQGQNKRKKAELSIDDYFSQKEIEQLGFGVQFRLKFPVMFKLYKRIKQLASVQ